MKNRLHKQQCFNDLFCVSAALLHSALQTTSSFTSASRLQEFPPRLAAVQIFSKQNVCHHSSKTCTGFIFSSYDTPLMSIFRLLRLVLPQEEDFTCLDVRKLIRSSPFAILWATEGMTVLCEMPTIQHLARRALLSMHKLFTSCIRRDLVSRDSIVDGHWLPATEWCQCYLPCCQPSSDVRENLRFHVRSVKARRMTLNWFHQ